MLLDIENQLDNYSLNYPNLARKLGLGKGNQYVPMIDLLIKEFESQAQAILQQIHDAERQLNHQILEDKYKNSVNHQISKSIFTASDPHGTDNYSNQLNEGAKLTYRTHDAVEIGYTIISDTQFQPLVVTAINKQQNQVVIEIKVIDTIKQNTINNISFYINHHQNVQMRLLEMIFFNKGFCLKTNDKSIAIKKVYLTHHQLKLNEEPDTLLRDYFNFRERYYFISIEFEERQLNHLSISIPLNKYLIPSSYDQSFYVNSFIAENRFIKIAEPLGFIKNEEKKLSICHQKPNAYQLLTIKNIRYDSDRPPETIIRRQLNDWTIEATHIEMPTTLSIKTWVKNTYGILDSLTVGDNFKIDNGDISLELLTKPRLNKRYEFPEKLASLSVFDISFIRDKDTLKDFLRNYVNEEEQLLILDGISQFKVSTPIVVEKGAITTQWILCMTLVENYIGDRGELLLFSYVIHRFYQCSLSLKYQVKTRVYIDESTLLKEFNWDD